MKRATVFSFSNRGAALAQTIVRVLTDWEVECLAPKGNLQECVAQHFTQSDALIFVGACGIAVRAIAPLVKDKRRDPAVIVMDDRGTFAIPLLSGHIGGANALARYLAEHTGAMAVITTATDVNGRFSVDAWAARQGLWISDMEIARRFSADILDKKMPVHSEFPIVGNFPAGTYDGVDGNCGVVIACRDMRPFEQTLLLVPKILHVGIGCKRGTPSAKIRFAVEKALRSGHYLKQAVRDVGTIDIKSDEPGLIEFCTGESWKLRCFSAQNLRNCPGHFNGSAFVERTVGVDNVCERSAACAAGPGAQIVVQKLCADGVTVAIAQEEWSVSFE